jgi:hypothetical protein
MCLKSHVKLVATKSFRGDGDRSSIQKLNVATKFFRGTPRFWLHLLEKKGGKRRKRAFILCVMDA